MVALIHRYPLLRVVEEVLPSICKTGSYTIKSITNKVFASGDECELNEYHKFLKSQCGLTKDERKAEMGRFGGLKTQENIREIKSRIVQLETEMNLANERCERLESEFQKNYENSIHSHPRVSQTFSMI